MDIEGGGVRGSDLRNITMFEINNPSSVPVFKCCGSVGTDLDPPKTASDHWVRLLLLSSLTFKTPTKNFFLVFFCLLHFEGTFTSFSRIKSHKDVTKQ